MIMSKHITPDKFPLPPNIGSLILPNDPLADNLIAQEFAINEALPGLWREQGTALLIDENNFYHKAKAEGFSIDYGKLGHIVASRCNLLYSGIFSAHSVDNEHSLRRLEYLRRLGYDVKTKPVVGYYDADDNFVFKGNMDVALTATAMSLPPTISHVIIGSCDGDFIDLITPLREERGLTVSVMGITNRAKKGMNRDLMTAGDNFYDLQQIREHISA